MTGDRPMRVPSSLPAAEVERDESDTAFTPILRQVRSAVPPVLVAAFVDSQGECIDYVSSIDPYDAKVYAAHLLVLMDAVRESRAKLGLPDAVGLEIAGSEQGASDRSRSRDVTARGENGRDLEEDVLWK